MKCSWVLPNLAIGSDPRADQEFQELKLLQITAILSLQTDEDRGVGGIEGELAAAQSRFGDLQRLHRGLQPRRTSGRVYPKAWPHSNGCSNRETPCTFIARLFSIVVPGIGTLAGRHPFTRMSRLLTRRGGHPRCPRVRRCWIAMSASVRIGSDFVPGYGLPAYGDGITDCDSFE